MHYAIVFNYYEFRTQLSDTLDVPQFHKISITKSKCSHRKYIRLSSNRWTIYAKSLVKICQ